MFCFHEMIHIGIKVKSITELWGFKLGFGLVHHFWLALIISCI